MQDSKLTDSFCMEDEHFFESYEAERVNAEAPLTITFDSIEARPLSAKQIAHFTRFRRPVAWAMAAMGSLSLVALARQGIQPDSRREVVAHVDSSTAMRVNAAAENPASASALPGRSVLASEVERPSEAPWWWTELAESAVALMLEPTRPRTSESTPPSLPHSATLAMQASLVNDFTSDLLSMCRDVPV